MKKFWILNILLLAILTNTAGASVPQKINYQGKLTTTAGAPVNATVSMTFSIYDVATGGTALWTETQSVTVNNGIYNVQLGANNPIDTELTETKPYWLGVKVGSDAEMSPCVELTPGPYSLILMNTITVKNGNVGIGVEPSAKFHVGYGTLRSGDLKLESFSSATGETIRFDRDFIRFWSGSSGTTAMHLQNNGNMTVYGTLHVTGADLAEPFNMTDIDTLEMGDVVVIDSQNPRHVTKSTKAYDTMVAGIISSTEQAGYVAGSRSDGSSDKPVALVGRVMCKVSTENGVIQAGDLLTSSGTPGYAMKATEKNRMTGALLGKALETFEGETGMIMVLVALQ